LYLFSLCPAQSKKKDKGAKLLQRRFVFYKENHRQQISLRETIEFAIANIVQRAAHDKPLKRLERNF